MKSFYTMPKGEGFEGANLPRPSKTFQDISTLRESIRTLTAKPSVALFGASNANGYAGIELELSYDVSRAFAKSSHTVIVAKQGGISDRFLEGAGKNAVLIKREEDSASPAFQSVQTIPLKTNAIYKNAIANYSRAMVFLPGGFETLDFATEYITAIQIKAMPPIPTIFVDSGNGFWRSFFNWIMEAPVAKGMIFERELSGIYFASTPKEAVEIANRVGASQKPPNLLSLWKLAKEYEQDIAVGKKVLEEFGSPRATFFGSSRVLPGHEIYTQVWKATLLLNKMGVKAVSGGGSGIMEAVGRAGGKNAIGFIPKVLLHEGPSGNYVVVNSMFSRKELLSESKLFLVFPGGFGTQDEIFEVAAKAKYHNTKPVEIALIGKSFYSGLFEWLSKHPLLKGFINEEDLKMFKLEDNPKAAILRNFGKSSSGQSSAG